MSLTVNIHEAKTNFSKLLKKAERGEEVIIAKAGHPIVKLISLENKTRKFGTAKGKVVIKDNFNEPLPDEILEYFK